MAIKQKVKNIILEYCGLAVGSAVMAVSLVFFLIPAKIAPGGVSGISIVLHYLFDLPVGLVMLVFNIPLFLLGLKVLGREFGPRTFFSFVLVSIFTDFFDKVLGFQGATEDPLLASIFGGVLLGVGLGVVFRFKGTTGGSDIVGQIINKYSNVSVGTGILIADFFVITFAGIAFRDVNLALYGFISLYFSSKVVDLILDGMDYARSFYIISEKQDEIINLITKEMDRGGTELSGTGFYTRKTRNVLYTVVTRREVTTLRQEILKIDPKAFVIIANVHEVIGEGFRKRI
ncbi:MAG TPA: YitT family protein [Candidatus Marinimicrobia bacterium]|nr:YitT family protein [Candidatus Neomarinimicrobiota bacterium]HRS52630.1 YitT family protein [Candidatus Neomarinimicrobiota bacterium]HRU92092.1 YitT family protein [Candidatus Neomarinimicrobiota bacterium]